jgi:ADP-ribose pyrophosphatase YjhB (NUDIX family)
MKRAAGILIIEDGKVLAVSRKNNQNDFGIPGGKCEEGEAFEDCAVRELFEETGLKAYGARQIFVEVDDCGWVMAACAVEGYVGEIKTNEAGKIAWLTPKELVTNSSFANYNKKLFDTLGIVYE